MTVVVLIREIEPDDGEQCSGRCPWRDGRRCTLFVTELVPKTARPFEADCQRSSECKTAEKQAEVIERWKRQDLKFRKMG